MMTVKTLSAMVLRWTYVAVVACCAGYLVLQAVFHSDWYKERLYHRLLTGNPNQQLRAATDLVRFDGEDQLLQALQATTSSARDTARRALEHLWFIRAGAEAFQLNQAAFQSSEKQDFDGALKVLNRLVAKYPTYAEGWNRRASVYWQMGEYEKSMADCERALALNPHHYGAWQGIGICHLQMGNVAEACRCLREALKITPYDETTRRSLRRCEELLRVYPHPGQREKTMDVI